MSNRTKFILSGVGTLVFGLLGAGVAFYLTEDDSGISLRTSATSVPSHELAPTASAQNESIAQGSSNQLWPSKGSAKKTAIVSGISVVGLVDPASKVSAADFDSHDTASTGKGSRELKDPSVRPTLVGNPEITWAHLPLAFLNYEGVLPSTPEVAAAIQHIQDQFMNSTGAGSPTIDPADPGYGRAWELAQPTADEQFYALFGSEAFNALSIAEARQRGHF